MKFSLLQLERQYIDALNDYGENSEETISASLKLLDTLNQTGKYFWTQGGEKYFLRALELAQPLNQNEHILLKYQTYLLYATYLEGLQQYSDAFSLLQQLLPLQTTKIKDILLMQIQILNHYIENGKKCKIEEVKSFVDIQIDLMKQVGLTFYSSKNFERKFKLILLHTLAMKAKLYTQEGNNKDAAQTYFECYHLSEELLGIHDERTIKFQQKSSEYQEKMSINIEIQYLDSEIPSMREEQEEYSQINDIIHSQHNYQIMVDAIKVPKQTKKISKDSIQNVKKQSFQLNAKDVSLQQVFIIKNNIKRPMSSQTTKLTSPARQPSFFSKKTSDRQNNQKIVSVEQSQIYDNMISQRNLTDLISARPQYEQIQQQQNNNYIIITKQQTTNQKVQLTVPKISRPQIREPSKNYLKNPSKNYVRDPSRGFIKDPSRNFIKDPSKNFINIKIEPTKKSITPSYQSIQRTSQKKIINEKPESNKFIPSDKEEEIVNDGTKHNNSILNENIVTFVDSPPKDPIIAQFLENHSMEVLLNAIDTIKNGWRNRKIKVKKIPLLDNLIQNQPSPDRGSTPHKSFARANTYGYGMLDIVDKLKQENEASKIIYRFFQSANEMEWYPVRFYEKLFTDYDTCVYVMQNPRFRGQCLQRQSDKEQFQSINVEAIQNMLSNPKQTSTLQVIGSIEIANSSRKIQIRFIIDSLTNHYQDIQQYDDMMDLFDQLLTIYFKQEDLLNEWLDQYKEHTLYSTAYSKRFNSGRRASNTQQTFTKEFQDRFQNKMQYYQFLLSKVLFLLNRKSYVKTMNGYKFKNENLSQKAQSHNNIVYNKKLQRIKDYFQISKTILEQNSQPKLSKTRTRKRTKERNLYIKEKQPTIIKEGSPIVEESLPPSQGATPYISLKDTGMLLGTEFSSKQINQGQSFIPETPIIFPHNAVFAPKSNFRQFAQQDVPPEKLEDIFSLEDQDYLKQYFPEFSLAIPSYEYKGSIIGSKRKTEYIDSQYHFRQQLKTIPKYQLLEYKSVYQESYLILIQIIKLEKQFYYLTLTNKIKLSQIFGSTTWEDEINIILKDLINYQIGRTGYIIDLIELQTILQQRIEIHNCQVILKEKQDSDQQEIKLKIYENNPQIYYIRETLEFMEQGQQDLSIRSDSDIESDERQPVIDIIFLLGILNAKYVLVPEHLAILPLATSTQLLTIQNNKYSFSEIKLPISPKFPFRLILSHEDMNKHISRTNEFTINGKDISLFPNFNSVFIQKEQYFIHSKIKAKLQIKSDIRNLHQDIRHNKANSLLFLYFNNSKKFIIHLDSKLTEKWCHLLQIEGMIRQNLFNFYATLKKHIIGRRLNQNCLKRSQSKNLRFLLMQDALKVKCYYIQTKINQLGRVFVQARVYQNLMLLLVTQQGNKTKSHMFLHPMQGDPLTQIYTITQQFIMVNTKTYTKLELNLITQNTIKKQYQLSNKFNDEQILTGQKKYSRVVYKQVKKIEKKYFIITVILIQNYFQIHFYNQNNCRKFCFTLHRCDFINMNRYFLDSVFPEQPQEILDELFRPWKYTEIQKLYSLIKKAPEVFKNRAKLSIQKIKNQVETLDNKKFLKRSYTSNVNENNQLQRKMTTYNKDEQEQNFYQECWLFDEILIRRNGSTLEKKLWMEIIGQIQISKNQILLNTYKNNLIELIFSDTTIANFICYMPCNEIQQSFKWQPIRLRILPYNTLKIFDVPLQCRDKQVIAGQKCIQLLKDYSQNNQIPSDQDIIKMNKRNDSKPLNYQLLYKGSFIKHKRMIIGIYLIKDIFEIHIQSETGSFLKKFKLSHVELKIPQISALLKLNSQEAGRRIMLTYRNTLIHASFLNL